MKKLMVIAVIAAVFAVSPAACNGEDGVIVPLDDGQYNLPPGQTAGQLAMNQQAVQNATNVTQASEDDPYLGGCDGGPDSLPEVEPVPSEDKEVTFGTTFGGYPISIVYDGDRTIAVIYKPEGLTVIVWEDGSTTWRDFPKH